MVKFLRCFIKTWVGSSAHVRNLGVFGCVYNSKLEGTNWNISGACKQVNLLNRWAPTFIDWGLVNSTLFSLCKFKIQLRDKGVRQIKNNANFLWIKLWKNIENLVAKWTSSYLFFQIEHFSHQADLKNKMKEKLWKVPDIDLWLHTYMNPYMWI